MNEERAKFDAFDDRRDRRQPMYAVETDWRLRKEKDVGSAARDEPEKDCVMVGSEADRFTASRLG